MSARDSPDVSSRAIEAGAQKFIPKPFEMGQLLDLITSTLGA
jgi:DNA-binding response OmpR family regulator